MKRPAPARLRPLLVLTLLLTTGCPVLGVRLLHVDYRVDGELVLRTYYNDPDARRADDPWDYLAERPIMVEDETCRVVPDPDDPLRATLTGEVTVDVLHVERSLRKAVLEKLVLVREDATDPRWYLPAREKDRTRP